MNILDQMHIRKYAAEWIELGVMGVGLLIIAAIGSMTSGQNTFNILIQVGVILVVIYSTTALIVYLAEEEYI